MNGSVPTIGSIERQSDISKSCAVPTASLYFCWTCAECLIPERSRWQMGDTLRGSRHVSRIAGSSPHVCDVFPIARIYDSHYAARCPEQAGLSKKSLTSVCVQQKAAWSLVCIVHRLYLIWVIRRYTHEIYVRAAFMCRHFGRAQVFQARTLSLCAIVHLATVVMSPAVRCSAGLLFELGAGCCTPTNKTHQPAEVQSSFVNCMCKQCANSGQAECENNRTTTTITAAHWT